MKLLSRLARFFAPPRITHADVCAGMFALVERHQREFDSRPIHWQDSSDGKLFARRLRDQRTLAQEFAHMPQPDLCASAFVLLDSREREVQP